MSLPGSPTPNQSLRANLDAATTVASLADTEPELPITSANRKRAWREPRAGSRLARVALVEEEGVLTWTYDPPPTSFRHRARRAGPEDNREVVHSFQFLEVPPNRLAHELESLDQRLTPQRNLRRWTRGQPADVPKAQFEDRTLLFIHGTFSKGDMFFQEFLAPEFKEGAAFLAACEKKYEAILTFDHPTLSVSPYLNALDLEVALARNKGPIDVICHSRGGLVAAWWLRNATSRVEKVIFVGSPLEGTSLAAPARLKAALDLLGNLSRGLGTIAGTAQTVVPMLAIAGGLMKIVGGLLSFGARSPILDAAVSVVPGLSAQSRVASNQELVRLLGQEWSTRPDLYAVISNFEPPEAQAPWWQFWKHFRNIPGQIADWGADIIFDGPNDLVVDTSSMTNLGDHVIPRNHRLDLSKSGTVHHCAYFRNKEAIDYMGEVLKVQ